MKRTLIFGGMTYEPDIRMLYDLSEVLFDRDILKHGNSELYYMYRDLALNQRDREMMMENRLRYDITVIPPGMLGREYTKTLGHYHPLVPETGLSYPEVYEVLSGEAHYLLQKRESGTISDVVLIRASAGDKVIIPPDYGHVTINAINEELKMANWVSREFSSVHQPYVTMQGAAYYMVKDGLMPNSKYGDVPDVCKVKPKSFTEIGLISGKGMYGLVHDIHSLDFLNRPQDFMGTFEDVFA
jgi:glucose-6-phosphate isomerase